MIYPVILSGGSGISLWPLSDVGLPNHFLQLPSQNTPFQDSVLRLSGFPEIEKPLVVCNNEHRFLVAEQLRKIDKQPLMEILEPVGRNTAPAVAVAAFAAQEKDGDAVLLVIPADHIIADVAAFHKAIHCAHLLAKQGHLVAFGIEPDAPSTQFDYIERGAALDVDHPAYSIARCSEKPDLEAAKAFLASGDFFWSSGMFAFKAAVYLHELQVFRPGIYQAAHHAWEQSIRDLDFCRLDENIYGICPSESINNALMSDTKSAAMVTVNIGWNDIRSWFGASGAIKAAGHGNSAWGDMSVDQSSESSVSSDLHAAKVIDNLHIPAWGLITGVVRNESILLDKLAFFNTLKSSGDLDQVVFSTWKGELDKYELIKSAIISYKFIVVESDEPDIVCAGHYLHQIIAIKNGLEACPDNSFILRARTDKNNPEHGFVNEDIAAFLKKRDYVKPCKDEFEIFDHKIGIMGNHIWMSNKYPIFFFWNDRVYFGAKKDIQKFLNFNILAFGYQSLIPEQALFSAPFLHDWPIFSIFFNAVRQIAIAGKFVLCNGALGDHLIKFLTDSRLFKRAFLTEKYLLHKYFFDISSGADFQFNATFHNVDMTSGQSNQRIFQKINDPNVQFSDFSEEIEELAAILRNEFSIQPTIHMTHDVGEIERFVFNTPSSNISITNRI
ncbi:mannose-1-phosphate guanylyltransferase [Undibacterium sp. GrIS 1.8]|uniref:mannose-1-phosphate guanylyltransferase n=1 Tax=Undibacterium sp. GrIS 1.8 TaxID=3143934 RepID=UPI0033975297